MTQADEGGYGPNFTNLRDDLPDPSVEDLAAIADRNLPAEERLQAFHRLLARAGGWWGESTLIEFVSAYSLAASRRALLPLGVPADRIDWESVADEALLTLYTSAPTKPIHYPKAWLMGVIRNLVSNELRRHFHEIAAEQVTEGIPAPATEEETPGREPSREWEKTILAAINSLPPKLRAVAYLYLGQRLSRSEVCEALGMKPAALRQSLSRIRKQLGKRLGELSRRQKK